MIDALDFNSSPIGRAAERARCLLRGKKRTLAQQLGRMIERDIETSSTLDCTSH
jgi:hypothetical protein